MASRMGSPEVYKFGGASLGDGAAFRHAAGIVKRCSAPVVAVCSAPAGVTDLLLDVADKARQGDAAKVATAMKTLRDRYGGILKTLELKTRVHDALAAQIETSLGELETL